MENYTVILIIMAIMIGLSALADKIKIPYPVLLIITGIGLGFIPSLPRTEINPDVIFLIFLPPLLYDAAFNLSFETFRTNISTISTLAISLVFVTAIGIAVVSYYLIPGMTWPVAFVLGSILSATDAVAAVNITKGLGLSHSTNTILEGESLVNDASALVAYRFAVAAVTGTSFIFWKASLSFVILMVGGFLVGGIMARLVGFFLSRLHHNFMVTIGLMLLMPFVTYLVAEELRVSGVIAVVILGLMISRFSKIIFPEDLKMQSKAIWDIIIFLLNGLIFILIGLQFPYLLKSIHPEDILRFTLYAFIITVVALSLRVIYVFLQRRNLLKAFRLQKRRITRDALLDFKSSVIISWSGMRGIVSLAIALGLPKYLDNGSHFPFRDPLIFISVAVVIFTLIGQGLSLPWVVKRLGAPEGRNSEEQAAQLSPTGNEKKEDNS